MSPGYTEIDWKMEAHYSHVVYATNNKSTVMSHNIARPLTLRTSPSDYATFNQVNSFLIFSIRLLLEREKQQKVFTLSFHGLAGEDFGIHLQKIFKKFRPKFQMTQTSYYLF